MAGTRRPHWRRGSLAARTARNRGRRARVREGDDARSRQPRRVDRPRARRVAQQQDLPKPSSCSSDTCRNTQEIVYAIHLLGTAYQRLGRTDEAEYALALARPGEPVWPDPWSDELAAVRVGFAQTLKAATAQLLSGQYAAAIPRLERAAPRASGRSLADAATRTELCRRRTNVPRAGAARSALDRDPDNLETHLRLASAYLNRHDYAQALAHAEPRRRAQPRARSRARVARHGALAWRATVGGSRGLSVRVSLRADESCRPTVWMGWILLEVAGRRTPIGILPARLGGTRCSPTRSSAWRSCSCDVDGSTKRDQALERAAKLEPRNPRLAARPDPARGARSSPAVARADEAAGRGASHRLALSALAALRPPPESRPIAATRHRRSRLVRGSRGSARHIVDAPFRA